MSRLHRIGPRPAALVLLAALVAGCTGEPILANEPARPPQPSFAATPAPTPPADPIPIELPRDDGPHDRLTEWWYYTGHLRDETGGRWGFEFVVFRAERGDFPVTWASHVALTDETGGRFHYAQRVEIGPQVDRSPRTPGGTPMGFDLSITGFDPSRPETFAQPSWAMSGSGGTDRLRATLSPGEAEAAGVPGLAFDLALSEGKPPVLHDGNGWIDFGPAGGSYYYSRTRMPAEGWLEVGGRRLTVEGTAWFDHQWGDFIAVGGGGWDWFAINLDDGTDLKVSLVRDADGSHQLVYGTLVEADGTARHVPAGELGVEVTGSWTSPHTGATYPAGWRITLPAELLEIELTPTVADQELDTRPTTGVVYWEGSQHVRATRDGRVLGGFAYVELTGYAPALP
jgi:predicted secreted hydrolase